MGLLDSLQSALQGGQQGGGSSSPLADALNSVGGYQGVLDMLQKSGLGDRVESWLSANSANLPIAPDEIRRRLATSVSSNWRASSGFRWIRWPASWRSICRPRSTRPAPAGCLRRATADTRGSKTNQDMALRQSGRAARRQHRCPAVNERASV